MLPASPHSTTRKSAISECDDVSTIAVWDFKRFLVTKIEQYDD
jgi:hypothetical protein